MRTGHRLVRIIFETDNLAHRLRRIGHGRMRQIGHDLRMLHLRIVDGQAGALLEQNLADGDGGRFARIAGVLLERKAKDADALVRDGVEQRLDNLRANIRWSVTIFSELFSAHTRTYLLRETRLLILVHADHLLPVGSHLWQIQSLAHVHNVENVLLEAAATEADRRLQELGADARVQSDGSCHLRHIGAGRLADRRHRVDAGDALRQKRVGRQLGELRTPRVRRDNALLGDPVLVHPRQRGDGSIAVHRLGAADQHPVWLVQVINGGALGEKLRIGEDVVANVCKRFGRDSNTVHSKNHFVHTYSACDSRSESA